MSIEKSFILRPYPHASRVNLMAYLAECQDGWLVTIEKPKRSNQQNALMWAVLTQLEPIDWYGNHLTKEEWKDVITASIKRLRVVPGIDGGFVVCGQNTSNMTIKEMNEVIEAAYALGSTHGVQFVEMESAS